ncbi:type VI secretion system protein [Aporhodopirellula aestuarii]|uniref:Type VI secretion system protein n=1 Tax=Aporhodopirellula aestuarii TaxID=2950107 RepID=A0ABT0TZ56_9BACT|nr:type VI secretion system protein [Aporhodopirellula aestuarii]MCM2369886.1 type VI secretion system protein [Aporhodopirellula aestuarii]
MLKALETIVLKISWLPGMGWLDTYVNALYHKKGAFDQTTGDIEVQAKQYKGLVTDPLGKGKAAAGDAAPDGGATPDAAGAASAAGGATAPSPAPGSQAAGAPPSAASPQQSTSPATATTSGIPPSYRAQRTATRASCLMFVFLFVMVAVVWALFLFDPKNVPWRHSMSWWRIGLQITLVFTIPIVLHRIIRLWLEGDQAKHPDIDYAWNHGMAALQSVGVNIDSVPLFLLIGSSNDQQELAIMGASRLEFRAASVPPGPASLHWYVTPSAVYLFATDVGWISSIASLASRTASVASPLQAAAMPSDAITFGQSGGPASAVEGTIMASDWQPHAAAAISNDPVKASPEAGQGTLLLDGQDGPAPFADSIQRDDIGQSIQPASKLSSGESAAALDRLRYLSNLIRSVRGALCPINGVVVLLPNRIMNASDDEVSEFGKAISSDLETVSREMQLRCPVSTLVTGMEKEAGFQEFIRRVGIDRAVWQRFGKKFEPDTENSRDELRSFSSHVVGAFEDWIYTLFRERESLSKPGNTNLYELLCNVRCSMKSRMERLLIDAFSNDSNPLLFSGCYFAATGPTADQQAFVRGVMDKLTDEQELLEWTDRARSEDRRIGWLSRLGWLAFLIGLAVIVYIAGHEWMLWW